MMKTVLLSLKYDLDKYGYLSNVIDSKLIKYFRKNNNNIIILPNYKFDKSFLNHIKFDRIILTGGGDINSKNKNEKIRLDLEFKLIKFALEKKIPLLGICRGMQSLCKFFNVKIKKIKGHVKKQHKIFLNEKVLLRNSFHNYGVYSKDLDPRFKILGRAKDNSIEFINLKKTKIYGMMWHPERQDFSKFKQDLSLINFDD